MTNDSPFAESVQSDLDALHRALSGELGADQERLSRIALSVVALLLRKNLDYGSSAWAPPVLAPTLEPGVAILVRLSDKIKRFQQLTSSGRNHIGESVEETMHDFAGYSLLWLARPVPTV